MHIESMVSHFELHDDAHTSYTLSAIHVYSLEWRKHAYFIVYNWQLKDYTYKYIFHTFRFAIRFETSKFADVSIGNIDMTKHNILHVWWN